MNNKERIVQAIVAALEGGVIDGAHHKQQALDRVIRILAGDRYEEVIASVEDWDDGTS